MNKEARTFLSKLTESDNSYVYGLCREAMRWAYMDAARVCRDSLYEEDDPTEIAARNIEARMK